MACWIWKFGEFETYHNLLVHQRRQAYGYTETPVWKLYSTDPNVTFSCVFKTDGGKVHLESQGETTTDLVPLAAEKLGIHEVSMQSIHFYGSHDFTIEPGEYRISIRVICQDSFPAVIAEGAVSTGPEWTADDLTLNPRPVGYWSKLQDPACKPKIFPFVYTLIEPVSVITVEGGCLADFGKESFGPIRIHTSSPCRIRLGESRAEAMDDTWAVIQWNKEPEEGIIELPPSAFRYVFVKPEKAEAPVRITAALELLPEEKRGSFTCSNELLNQIWQTAADTFHLNCREFFLDGIKRDRWVWSADAYQSLFVNRYLFADEALEERTLIALGGKQPFKRHINTIVDYTFFWFMSIREHFETYGNLHFVRQMIPQMKEIMTFLQKRVDPDGYVRGKEGDWVFIDWADMDKTGALLGEQVLFARALRDYAFLLEQAGEDGAIYEEQGKALQQKILQDFYRPLAGALVDSWESGKENITRQNNYLAYLFLPMPEEYRQNIYQNVAANPAVPPVTTPYFKFYEYQVLSLAGRTDLLMKDIDSYYGGMLSLGATSLYEQYDPTDQGDEHLAMYGRPFEKSLCHAWSASPIYILGVTHLGVKNTGIGYESFVVDPDLGDLEWMEGSVPVPGGMVFVKGWRDEEGQHYEIRSEVQGGAAADPEQAGGLRPIQPDETITIHKHNR